MKIRASVRKICEKCRQLIAELIIRTFQFIDAESRLNHHLSGLLI